MQIANYKLSRMTKKERAIAMCAMAALAVAMVAMFVVPAFAATNYVTTIRNIMNNMVGIVGVIFQAVGVILSVYAVGSLIMAFKNDDANSKSTASTLLVVGIVLIALPGIVSTLGLVNMIGG